VTGEAQFLKPAGLGEPLGLYSHGALLRGPTTLLFVAGQLGVDTDGNAIGSDFAAQLHQVFVNLGHVLRSARLEFSDVVKFTTYLVDAEHISDFYAVRAELFPSLFPTSRYPPNTLLVVQRLVRPEFLIEVEAVAGRSDGDVSDG
jgi:enamine deaminase RidA (YjgF/YER057c/UK114 family)